MPRTVRPSGTPGTDELAAILECVALPVWVLDHNGFVVFVNPAGLAALGYDDLAELRGRPGHDTIHYKRRDGSPYPAEECPLARVRGLGVTVHEDDDWFIRRDGSMFPVAYTSTPIDLPGGLGAVVAFQDMRAQREAEQALRERDVAEARAEALQAARRRVIEAHDAARAQLERDLHDGAQQHFVSAVMNLRLAERLEGTDRERARGLRATGIDLAADGLAELRRLAAGIHPAVLTDHGLGPAVEALAARLPLIVSVENATPGRLPAPVEASVYFFVCEALTNTVKHANADEARVRIAAADHELTVEVADDGVGGAQARGGTGLRGLGDRVGALDGALELDSPPNGGTLLRARIPLPQG